MKNKIIVLMLLVFGYATQLFAHAPWIETSPIGTKGRIHEVKIFFGEFSDKNISPASKWFSDLKNFKLILITPGKKEIELSSTPAGDYFAAQFTPTEDGLYTVVMHHIVRDTYAGMKIDYNSSAGVLVGGFDPGLQPAINPNIVSLGSDAAFSAQHDKKLTVKAIYDGKPAAKQEIKIVAPNGWAKELHADEKGEVVFTALWPGKYLAEYAYIDKTPGEHNGKKYEETRKVATYMIEVK